MKDSTMVVMGLALAGVAFFLGKGTAKASTLPALVLSPQSVPVTPNHRPIVRPTILPPGTSPVVIKAVKEAQAAGTLTQGQQEAVEQLYAPLYYTEGGYEIPYGVNPETGEVHGPATVIDFGSEEAARAALEAYMANFRDAPSY